ncbi:MAG: tRNA (N(6)-L-threonylcarbamoyladenosine(37)-C(2))-methylthiotransferase [Candidatus Aenigmarchaeota archaeon]|nr:tRNA (N(6)-L-threonylcarbamoyladenosine(37)-C(2))-methylthiotransferase [Candidatus Aenigmarchaeota archaeon]
MTNVYVESYGCSNSQAEGEAIAGLLKNSGFRIVDNEKNAGLLIFVTCYVKTPTEHKILRRISDIIEEYPRKKIIISGCMPEGIHEILVKKFPNASLVSTHHVNDIVKAAKQTIKGKRIELVGKSNQVKACLAKIRKNSLIDIVPISTGCNSSCSYCCVRLAKGKLFSYPKEDILKEVRNSIKQGCKEMWITSQDNASYGNGKLPELLNDMTKIRGDFMIRVGMMNPRNVLPILPKLIRAYENEKVYKFLHLPVQSGDDAILKKMNRGHSVRDFEKIISKFKQSFRCNLWSDVIVGFPGETEEQFQNTIDLVKKVRPDWVNVSKYGSRPNTPAAKMKQVNSDAIIKRSIKLSKIVRQLSLEKNKEWLGWKGRILLFKKGNKKNQWFGRNCAYKLFIVELEGNNFGKFVNVEAIKADKAYILSESV